MINRNSLDKRESWQAIVLKVRRRYLGAAREYCQESGRVIEPPTFRSLFAEDVAASGLSEEVSATRDFRMLLQAQLAGVLLSIIMQLSLLGDRNLKLQLHDGAEQLLCKLALGKSTHYHPELDPLATLMQNSRPDVHNKMIELYQ